MHFTSTAVSTSHRATATISHLHLRLQPAPAPAHTGLFPKSPSSSSSTAAMQDITFTIHVLQLDLTRTGICSFMIESTLTSSAPTSAHYALQAETSVRVSRIPSLFSLTTIIICTYVWCPLYPRGDFKLRPIVSRTTMADLHNAACLSRPCGIRCVRIGCFHLE